MNERIKELAEQAEVKQLFDYVDGKLFWRVHIPHSNVKGKEAGCLTGSGYKEVWFQRKRYSVHRLIWIYHNGNCLDVIDHINGNKTDNRIENLRLATKTQNQLNRTTDKRNTSGYKNVSWDKNSQKWKTAFSIKGKHYHFGLFDDVELAGLVATMAREKYHGQFANHGEQQ